ncbi:hypothetical protein [Chitinimonas naiadis]
MKEVRIAAIALATLLLAGCSDEPKQPPKTIKEISQYITNVQELDGGKTLAVSITNESVFAGGNATKDVLSGLKAHFLNLAFEEVKVTLVGQLVDKYGKEFNQPILVLTYPRAELNKMEFKNLVGWQVLDLAQVTVLPPSGFGVGREACKEENMAKFAPGFCEHFQ